MAHQLPTGVQAHPDGEQQQERYREGKLLFERQWRQTLVAEQSGDYQLPRLTCPGLIPKVAGLSRPACPPSR